MIYFATELLLMIGCKTVGFIYVYIGITSLCLYNITKIAYLQYGKLYKMTQKFLCKKQKMILQWENVLTWNAVG